MKPTIVRTVLISLLLLVQLATVTIVVMGMRNKTTEQVAGNATLALSGLSNRIEERANQVIDPAQQVLLAGREMIATGTLDVRTDKTVESFLLAQLRVHPMLSRLQLVRDNGAIIDATRAQGSDEITTRIVTGEGISQQVLNTNFDAQGQRVRSWVDPTEPEDPRQAAWYEAALSSQELVWSQVGELAADGSAGLVAALATTLPDASDAGVLNVTVATSALASRLSGLGLGDNGALALVDASGNTLAQYSGESLTMAFDPVQTPAIETVAQPALRGLFNDLGIELVSEESLLSQASQFSNVHRYEANGQEMIGVAQPLDLAGGKIPLLLAAAAPASSYMGSLNELFNRKLRTLLAVILIPALIAVLALFGLNEPKSESTEDSATDRLTGFLKRAEFRRRLAGMLSNRRELEFGGRTVVVALEIDGFSRLTARYGRQVGEVVLKQFSRRLRSRVRQHDLIGRTGPDEFVIALRIDEGVDVLTTVNRIRRATVIKPFVTNAARHILGVTAGIATIDPDETVDDLIARADQALVTGKARHRNRSYLASAPDTTWPQTGIALPNEDPATTPDRHAPLLEV